jgi:hypothetical protein
MMTLNNENVQTVEKYLVFFGLALSLVLPLLTLKRGVVICVVFFGNFSIGLFPLAVELYTIRYWGKMVRAGDSGIGMLVIVPTIYTIISNGIVLWRIRQSERKEREGIGIHEK